VEKQGLEFVEYMRGSLSRLQTLERTREVLHTSGANLEKRRWEFSAPTQGNQGQHPTPPGGLDMGCLEFTEKRNIWAQNCHSGPLVLERGRVGKTENTARKQEGDQQKT